MHCEGADTEIPHERDILRTRSMAKSQDEKHSRNVGGRLELDDDESL